MNNFSSPDRINSFILPVLIIIGIIFFINFLYSFFVTDDYDKETITVEFHCPTVLAMKDHYPSFIITECQKLYEN